MITPKLSNIGKAMPHDMPVDVAADDGWSRTFEVVDDDLVAVDVSGWTWLAQVVDITTGDVELTLTTTVGGTDDNIVTVAATAAQVATLTEKTRYRWRLQYTVPGSQPLTPIAGVWRVAPPGESSTYQTSPADSVTIRIADGVRLVLGLQGPAGTDIDATLTTDGDILTRTTGAPAPITRAALAADPAFSDQYAPLNAARRVASLSVGSFGAYPRVADSTDWEALFEHTVPAGTLNDSGAALVFHAGGTVRNNSGGTVSVNLRVPWGEGFALTAIGAIDCTPSANRRKWTLTLVGTQIFEDGTTSNTGDLEWAGDFKFTTPGSGEWRPILASACYIGSGLSVRSPLVNNRFAIEAQLGTASADAEIDVRSATLFVVPAN